MAQVITETFGAAPGGMNAAFPAAEIADTEAAYLQDALVDLPGVMRSRGPIQKVVGAAGTTVGEFFSGLAVALNPAGALRILGLAGNNAAGKALLWSNDLTSTVAISWPYFLPASPASSAANAFRWFDSKPALNGGTFVGTSNTLSTSPEQVLAFWRGGNKAVYNTGTVTFTKGGATLSGSGTSWLANVTNGMFVFAQSTDYPTKYAYLGTVLSVNADNSITMEKPIPYAGTTVSYFICPLRGILPRVVKGRITCETGSTTVTGGATKFKSQGLNVGSWDLYRSSDMTWIGKVSSVTSDTSLTLNANAAVALVDELYVAMRADWLTASDPLETAITTNSTNRVGFLSAVYAGRQWFANNGSSFDKTYRVWFSDPTDFEGLDLSQDGDWFPITSTTDAPEPIKALVPTYNALLVFKDTETFAIYGASPASFSPKKLEDDGTLSAMSVQPYGGGAVWAGRQGIWYYDGVSAKNILADKLGIIWKNSVAAIDWSRYKMWSALNREHYFLHLELVEPTIDVTKGNLTVTPTHWVVCINMTTLAVTLLTNVKFRGAVTLPESYGRGMYFVGNTIADNLVTNPSLEVDTTGWTDSAAHVLTRSTAVSKYGAASLKAERDTLASTDPVMATTAVTVPSAGRYVLSAWVYIPTAWNGATAPFVQLSGFAGSTLVSSSPADLTKRDQWQRINEVRDIVGGDLVGTADLWGASSYSGTVPALNRFLYWDAMRMELGDTPKTYFEGDNTSKGFLFDGDALFDVDALDQVALDAYKVGPDFYFASKKLAGGDQMLLKRFKQIAMHYLAQGGRLNTVTGVLEALAIDVVVGLNDIGVTLGTKLPASVYTWDQLSNLFTDWDALEATYSNWDDIVNAVFKPKRARFLKKSQHFQFRVWRVDDTVTRVRIGPQQVLYKPMRPGRV